MVRYVSLEISKRHTTEHLGKVTIEKWEVGNGKVEIMMFVIDFSLKSPLCQYCRKY